MFTSLRVYYKFFYLLLYHIDCDVNDQEADDTDYDPFFSY